jgi:hypothetical protein
MVFRKYNQCIPKLFTESVVSSLPKINLHVQTFLYGCLFALLILAAVLVFNLALYQSIPPILLLP